MFRISWKVVSTGSTGNGDWSKNKKAIINSIDEHKGRLIEISGQIWAAAETSLEEFKSSKYLSDYALENGFSVEIGVAGMPTEFIAKYGSGRPYIGIMGEFDANSGISQKKKPSKEPLIEGAPGHGCGHNLFGTGNHSGNVHGGHYTANIKNPNGKWYNFNDTNVSEIKNVEQLKTNKAYCFFYRKKILQ